LHLQMLLTVQYLCLQLQIQVLPKVLLFDQEICFRLQMINHGHFILT
jgi:hypothetical protein